MIKKKENLLCYHGAVPRSQCYIYIIPKYDMGAVIISNQSGTDTDKIMENAINEGFEKIIVKEKND
ncbi:hypothetical protein [Flavobacterium sp. C3NV]|uniref:hypothetical protein n=1 Tax=Flavobacterium sp. C3NV TaxID=3393358 RepID=UPI00398FECD7